MAVFSVTPTQTSFNVQVGENTAATLRARDEAEGFADDAAASAALAQTIIEAAVLPEFRYQTRAAANAAVGGLANGAAVLIYADESYGQRPTMNEVVGGAVEWRATLYPSLATIYWDGRDGNDTNNGLTAETAVKTWAAAIAKAQPGDTILGRAGIVNHGAFSMGTKPFLTLGAYNVNDNMGTNSIGGGKLILDGSRPVPAAAFVQDPDDAARWYFDWAHETEPVAPSNGFCLYEERSVGLSKALFPKWTAGSIDANRAFLNANRDHFTCHKIGDTNPDPRSSTSGVNFRYYVCPPAGLNPSTGQITYYVQEFQQVLSQFTGATMRNVVCQRSGNGSLAGHNQHRAFLVEDCEFNSGHQHGWTGGAMIMRRCRAVANPKGGDQTIPGAGIHFFESGSGQKAYMEDCYVDGYGFNFYSHADTQITADHGEVYCRNLVSRNAQRLAFAVGNNTTRGVHVDGFDSFNDAGGMQLTGLSTVKNFRVHVKDPSSSLLILTGVPGRTVSLKNGSLIVSGTPVPGTQGGTLAIRDGADFNDFGAMTLDMEDVTVVGAKFSGSVDLKNIDYVARRCILGEIDPVPSSTVPFNSLTATNCSLSWARRSLAEIQAIAPGVAASCVVPWVDQPFIKTLGSGDISYRAADMFASTPDAGNLARVAFNTVKGIGVGDTIRIVDFNGSGDNHVCRLIAEISTNNYTVSPALPSAIVESKAVQFGHFNRKIFPVALAATAVFSDDGTQAYFSSVTDISDGMTVYFGGIGRGQPFGPRKIVTLSGQTATLDRPVNWNRFPSGAIEYSAFGATNRNPRPSVPVSFGFPIRPVLFDGTFATTWENETQAVTYQENNASNIGGRFNIPFKVDFMSGVLADGTLTPDGVGQIKHVIGEIDTGFNPVGSGDTAALRAVVYVDDYAPQFATDPALSGLAALRPGTVLADLGLGARGNAT